MEAYAICLYSESKTLLQGLAKGEGDIYSRLVVDAFE